MGIADKARTEPPAFIPIFRKSRRAIILSFFTFASRRALLLVFRSYLFCPVHRSLSKSTNRPWGNGLSRKSVAPCRIRSTAPCNDKSWPVKIAGTCAWRHFSSISCGEQSARLDSLITATRLSASSAASNSVQCDRTCTSKSSPRNRTTSASLTLVSGSIRTTTPLFFFCLIPEPPLKSFKCFYKTGQAIGCMLTPPSVITIRENT